MKPFFILLIGLLCCLNGWADEVKIPLEKKVSGNYESGPRDERSLSNEPVATHDGSQVYIYSEKTLENVCIRVTDSQGITCFEQEVNSIVGQYVFRLSMLGSGIFTLSIFTSEEVYEGEFVLE